MLNEKKKSNNVVLTIIICFLVVFCGLGAIQPRGLFVVSITTALGIKRSVYSVSDTIRSATSAIVNIFFGILVEKLGTKKLLCAGFMAYMLAALMFALAENVVLLYLGGFLLGIGVAWSSSAIVGYILTKVCTKNRGIILGIVFAANGVGGAVFAQVYNMSLVNGDPFGYRNAYYIMAIIFATIFVIILIFFKNPTSLGTGESYKKQRTFTWEGITFKQAKKPFISILCVFACLLRVFLCRDFRLCARLICPTWE